MFSPLNRHLLLEKIEEKTDEKKSTILVPDDYKIKTSPYGMYVVLRKAPDCEKVKNVGATVVVNEAMVEEISVNNRKYHLILENYVYGLYV